jgi:hypothetical protein
VALSCAASINWFCDGDGEFIKVFYSPPNAQVIDFLKKYSNLH